MWLKMKRLPIFDLSHGFSFLKKYFKINQNKLSERKKVDLKVKSWETDAKLTYRNF